MYINFNEEKFNELINEIKQTCQLKGISFPSILNRDISNEYIFPDDEGEELKQFLEYFSEFKSIVKFILDKEQEEVVTYDNHKFLSVEAGPGAGKTRVLVEKVKYMVNELGVKPESILIITFTKKAAEEFQERLIESKLLKSDVQKMKISTIHSFCIDILEENDIVGYDIFDDIYGEKVNMFVGEHLPALGFVREYFIPDSFIPIVLRKYDEYSMFDVNIDELVDYIQKEKPIDLEYIEFINSYSNTHSKNFLINELNKNKRFKQSWYNAIHLQIARSYPRYLALLEKYHAIDFGQIQIKALNLLEDNNNLKYINVLIDEFQETTPIQMKIFERLMDNIQSHNYEKTSFTVVGDINQSIYGFIGSKNYFKYLLNNSADFEFMSLPTNYRSTNQIIEISEDFIKYRRHSHSAFKKPKYGRKENNNVYYMLNEDKASEATNIFEIIKYLKKEGKINNYSDIGILSRSVSGGKFNDLLNLLEEHNLKNPDDKIPYEIKGLNDLIEKDEIKSIITLMYHLVHDDNPHNYTMNRWNLDWLNLKAFTGANFKQVLFDLSEDTKIILNDLQDEFEQNVIDLEKIIYKEVTGKTSRIRTFKGVFHRDKEILREIFNRIERPFLSDENLKKYGVTNKKDIKFFKKLNELKYKVTSNEIDFPNKLTINEVYFDLLTKVTGYLTEENINLHEEEIYNLSSITDTLSNFEEIRYEHDFKGFFNFIYRTIEKHDAYAPKNDGVQIMTVHKSKGKEFPVVILASLRDNYFPLTSHNRFNFIDGIFYTPIQYLKYKPDDIYEDYKIHDEEEERIIYVGMSRAQDTLILSSIVDNCEESRNIALSRSDDIEYIKSVKKGPECVQRAIDANLDKGCILINPNNIKIDTIQRDSKPQKRNLVELSFTSFENYRFCPFKYKLSNILNFNKSRRRGLKDAIFIHEALNAINKRIKFNNNIYIGDKEVMQTVDEVIYKKNREIFFDGTYNQIINDVLYYYNNYGKNIKIVDTGYLFHLKDKHYVLNGKIDLIYERDGKLVIVDYVDNSLDWNDELKEKYMQLHLHVLVLRDQNQEYLGRNIGEIEIYAIKSNEVLTFKIDEEIIGKLQEELKSVALSIKKGEFNSRKSDNCRNCQYLEICNQNVENN